MDINLIKNKSSIDFLSTIPNYIKEESKLKVIEKGKMVVLKERRIDYIYIHFEGKMRVRNEFENGFIYDFATIKPISYIGVMEVMANKERYTSTLESITECIILEIPKNLFIKWINKDHDLSLKVLSFVSMSMYEQSLKIGEGLAYPAKIILIDYLLNRYKSERKEKVIIENTREEIASTLGFSVRTINRNLKVLKDKSLLTVTRKNIVINKEQYINLSEKLNLLK